jgi:hypothetical protein
MLIDCEKLVGIVGRMKYMCPQRADTWLQHGIWRQGTASCMEHVGGKEQLAAWNMLAARNS